MEILHALAVIGIVAALWTPLRHSSPAMAVGYLGVRLIEAMLCTTAALMPMALMDLAEQHTRAGPDDHSGTDGLANIVNLVRDNALNYGVPIFFGVSAAVLYFILYRSALVPKYITIWGLIGVAGIIANVFVSTAAVQPLFVLPIITNEIYLGIYLLTKGLLQPTAPAARRL